MNIDGIFDDFLKSFYHCPKFCNSTKFARRESKQDKFSKRKKRNMYKQTNSSNSNKQKQKEKNNTSLSSTTTAAMTTQI